MGNYRRPKPLDEIGNMHVKSMEAEKEIKKGSSKLGTVKAPVSDAFSDERTPEPGKVTPEQKAADEIAREVEDFAKTFGNTGTGRAPASITAVQSRPRVPKKKPEAVAEETGKSKRVPVQKDSKTKLIRNSERTNLFDSYMSVMNDEDDSGLELEEGTKRGLRKKKAEKKSKASSAKTVKAEEMSDAVSAQADKAVASVFGDDKEEVLPVAEIAEGDISVSQEDVGTPFEIADEQDEYSKETAVTGNPVRRIVLTAALLLVLVLSVTVGGIKAFLKLNSDAVAFGGYQLYSAESSYNGTGIEKNDLVFVENRQPSQGDTIAYRDSSGKYGFATFEAALNSESMTVTGSNDKLVVFVNEYRGAVIKTVPVIGGVLAVCTTYFLPIMALMFLIIGLLILLIFFTSKGKTDKDDSKEEAQEIEEEATEASVADPFEAFASGDSFDEYEAEEENEAAQEEEAVEEESPDEDGDAQEDVYYVPGNTYELFDDDSDE